MNYDILMIDPPWKKSKGGLRKSDSKKIDVFSREKRIGWDVWGNETDKFSTIDCVVCGKKIEVYGE